MTLGGQERPGEETAQLWWSPQEPGDAGAIGRAVQAGELELPGSFGTQRIVSGFQTFLHCSFWYCLI